jgi:hypothetical protein
MRPGRSAAGGHRGHAVVLGAGMAGLLAARVLAGHFEQVTVVDRTGSRTGRASGRDRPRRRGGGRSGGGRQRPRVPRPTVAGRARLPGAGRDPHQLPARLREPAVCDPGRLPARLAHAPDQRQAARERPHRRPGPHRRRPLDGGPDRRRPRPPADRRRGVPRVRAGAAQPAAVRDHQGRRAGLAGLRLPQPRQPAAPVRTAAPPAGAVRGDRDASCTFNPINARA